MFKQLLIVIVILGLFQGSKSQPQVLQNKPDVNIGRIVGGFNATLGMFPHQVSLRIADMSHVCGGSIIGQNWVLTAAHCIYGLKIKYVVAGSILLKGGKRLNVHKVEMHPLYDRTRIAYDIGLIKIRDFFEYSSLIKPISLPTVNIDGGLEVIVSGWGLTSYPGTTPPNVLQAIKLTTLTVAACQKALGPAITNAHLCTFTSIGSGTCSGDSGGPLIYNNAIHGVVSFGKPCALGVPDGFTRVFSFVPWIKNVVMQN